MTTTTDIREYVLCNSPWVNRTTTVDTVLFGDADRPVNKAGVCWYASIETIRAAHKAGCDLLVCHEPVFWEHAPRETRWLDKEPGRAKKGLLDQTGMTILRLHDSWDQWPDTGIRDSWAACLGVEKRVYESAGHRFHAAYEAPQQSLRAFAQYVARKIKPLGENYVQVMGDPERPIKCVGIGVGCIGPDESVVDAGADVLIHCFDGAPYWAVRERLHEHGAAIVTVEHGISEMPGIENLCKHLAETFPAIQFEYFAEHPRTWVVKAE